MNTKINHHRQIILDTETTGMNQVGAHYEGHCIIEIGAVEMIERKYTGRKLHLYIKPDRAVDPDAIKVHGITDEMLADKPDFAAIAQQFIDFIKGAELLIHNAPFDVGFMDYEFSKHGFTLKTEDICNVVDTLTLARQMYPGKRNSLDALCDRLAIDNSKRTLHGALLDAEILGDVYLAMTGGQTNLFDEAENEQHHHFQAMRLMQNSNNIHQNLPIYALSEQEIAEHNAYLEFVNKKSKGNCLWLNAQNADYQQKTEH